MECSEKTHNYALQTCYRLNMSVKQRKVNNELENIFSKALDFDDSFECTQIPFKTFLITEAEILINIHKIKSHKVTGSDNISKFFLKYAAAFIAHPLCHTFNYILTSNSYPSSCKQSYRSPIPKTKPTQIDTLPPISLFPTISKVFERLYLNQLQKIIVPNYSVKINKFLVTKYPYHQVYGKELFYSYFIFLFYLRSTFDNSYVYKYANDTAIILLTLPQKFLRTKFPKKSK